jgi:HemY protein
VKFLFWILGLFVLAVVLTLATHNPGYVLLFYPPYRAEMPLSLFVIALLLLFMLIYLALRLIFATVRLPEYVRNFRNERAQEKGRKALLEALTAFFEGRYASAEQAAVQAMKMGEDSGLNLIIAAHAAHELREYSRRDAYLEEAKVRPAGEATMRLIATAKFNLDQHQPQAALEALKELRNSGALIHTGILRMELLAQQQAHNWDAILDVLSQLEKRNAMDTAIVEQIRQQAWLGKIHSASQNDTALKEVWKGIPRQFRLQSIISAAAARAFMQLDEHAISREIITASLNIQWDGDLSRLYGDCIPDDMAGQIEQAERWLQSHSQDAGLLLALGKLCLRQQLWEKAQNYLEASASISPSRTAYLELGKLADLLQKPNDALGYFRQALEFGDN